MCYWSEECEFLHFLSGLIENRSSIDDTQSVDLCVKILQFLRQEAITDVFFSDDYRGGHGGGRDDDRR